MFILYTLNPSKRVWCLNSTKHITRKEFGYLVVKIKIEELGWALGEGRGPGSSLNKIVYL